MKAYDIAEFKNGWIIGDFEPSILRTSNFEVAVHKYDAGFKGIPHYHKISNEYNIIISGKVDVNGLELGPGKVFVYAPCEISNCQFIEDTTLVIVRDASNTQDKFLI
jgi:hypothetical protein